MKAVLYPNFQKKNALGCAREVCDVLHTAGIDVVVDSEYTSEFGDKEFVSFADITSLASSADIFIKLNEMDEEIATHTHDGYVSSDNLQTLADSLQTLEDIVDTKANSSHSHSEYALIGHLHSDYATQVALDTLAEEVDGKADANHSHTGYASESHIHTEYAEVGHTHSEYAATAHTHDYASSTHNHDSAYASISHDHDDDYATLNHSHSDYATVASVNTLSTTVSGKANASHDHDDRYYTETEIDDKLAAKADSSHNHTGTYDASGAAANALTSANAYTDSKIDALVGEGASTTLDTIGEISSAIEDNQDMIDTLNAAIGNKANASDLTSHTSNTTIHVTETEKAIWNSKSNFSGNYNDLTNKPTIPSINGLATEVYVDEAVSGITVESIGALPDTTVIPTIPTNISSFVNDAGYLTEHQSLDGLATETYVNTQIDAIVIPDSLSDLTADSTHRTVTDAEKSVWNAKSNFSGSYNDLTNKPAIPSIAGLATETYVDEAVSAKADTGHNHNDVYYTETEINTLLSNKANSNHNHNSSYDVLGTAQTKANEVQANLDEAIDEFNAHAENADIHFTVAERNKLSGIASNANNYTLPSAGTNLGGVKSGGDVVISSGLITVNDDSHNHIIANVDGLQSALDSKASSGHTHDDTYYTETEIDSLLAGKANSSHTHTIANVNGLQSALNGKSDSTHNHDSAYDAKGAANTALASAKEYTDDAIADEVVARDSAIATAKSSAISTAASDATTKANNALASAKTYADSAVATAKNDLLNGAGAAYDTLKELGDLIDENVDAIEALEAVAAGKANASHTHAIANITNLQSTLDGKAAASHGTHVTYSTTAPSMDGTASVGTATTVARSDHKHPTDTSRAAQTSLDSHTSNKSNPHSVTLAQLGVTATAAELNYVDGVTSNIQTQLNGKAASGHTHGAATTSASGFMTKDMVTKLNGIAAGANAYAHPTYTARTGVPTANQTPAFGGTFTVSQPVSDGTGHITAVNSRTITIPSAVVTTSANGLMSKSDKSKLDGMVFATVSEVETYLGI